MKRIIVLLCAVAWLTACKDDKDEPWESGRVSRAVMVYMAGENNLTVSSNYRYLRNDLNEIIKGSELLTDDQRLFVFVDSLVTNKGDAEKEGKGLPCILEVHGGQTYVRYQFDQEIYASDPAYFRQILQWMTANAEADDYGLVLWGHACGWAVMTDTVAQARMATTRAYGQDDGKDMTGGSRKWMNITQMAKAMQGLPKLKFIFADCCNMMCAEVGYELRNATEYLIGSPAEIPGDGAPYDKIVPYLYANGSNLYRNIIDTYYNYYLDDFRDEYSLDGYSVPLSVIDTKYMDQLASATHDILGSFVPEKPEGTSLSNIAYYWYYDTPVMYDMKAVVKTNATEGDYNNWVKVFNQAVPYSRMSMKWMTIYSKLESNFRNFTQDESMYGCVSMFVPLNSYYYNYGEFKYNKTSTSMEWNRAMEWNRFGW